MSISDHTKLKVSLLLKCQTFVRNQFLGGARNLRFALNYAKVQKFKATCSEVCKAVNRSKYTHKALRVSTLSKFQSITGKSSEAQ